jgi:hypothetical protein
MLLPTRRRAGRAGQRARATSRPVGARSLPARGQLIPRYCQKQYVRLPDVMSENRPDSRERRQQIRLSSAFCKPLRNLDTTDSRCVPLRSAGSRSRWPRSGEGIRSRSASPICRPLAWWSRSLADRQTASYAGSFGRDPPCTGASVHERTVHGGQSRNQTAPAASPAMMTVAVAATAT